MRLAGGFREFSGQVAVVVDLDLAEAQPPGELRQLGRQFPGHGAPVDTGFGVGGLDHQRVLPAV